MPQIFKKVVRDLEPGMGQAVAERTILRKIDGNGWETWKDVATRVAAGNALLEPDPKKKESEFDILNHHISKATVLMSGRHLQHGDLQQPTRNMEVYTNCATAPTSFLLFYFLLNGSGVGRCYDDDFILVDWDNAPTVRCVLSDTHPDFDFSAHESARDAKHKYGTGKDVLWFEVPDSREGWAKALEIWENAAFEKIHKDKMLILDFSKVRPKGAPIGGMQNRPSSGPVAIMNAFNKAGSLKGSKLDPWKQAMYVDHYFAECVLVGGARRAARMSTKSWRDKNIFDFIQIKRPIEYYGLDQEEIKELKTKINPYGFLWSSNNSVAVDSDFWTLVNLKKTEDEFGSDIAKHARKVFKMLAECSYGDGTGEPGILNVDTFTQNNSGWDDLNRGDYAYSKKYQTSEDTHILLSKLAKKAKKKKYTMITNPCLSGNTPITTDKGEVAIQKIIEDGIENYKVLTYNESTKQNEWKPLVDGFKTKENANVIKLVLENNREIILTPDHKVFTKNRGWIEAAMLTTEDDLISSIDGPSKLSIKSISPESNRDVYDLVVEDNHNFFANGLLVHNCGEICLVILGGFCVIGDVVPYHADTLEEAEDAFRATTRALIRVNTMDSVYNKEVRRTNRIGVSITGIHEFAWKFFGYGFQDLIDEEKSKDFWMCMARFHKAVREEAESYSKQLGLEIPHTMTTIKPSGTTAKLFGLTEGWHLPSMPYYLRWVQFRSDSEQVQIYKKAGYPIKDLIQYSGTTVVGFPTAPTIATLGMGDKLITAGDATPEEQYKWLMLGEKYWIDGVKEDGSKFEDKKGNQISYTLKYKPESVDYKGFKDMLLKYQSQIKCCSVMPQVDMIAFEYQPEEPITKAQYEQMTRSIMKPVIGEEVDKVHVDCSTGACPIDFNSEETKH